MSWFAKRMFYPSPPPTESVAAACRLEPAARVRRPDSGPDSKHARRGQGHLLHALPERPGALNGQQPGRRDGRRASDRVHHQRDWRARGERLPRRSRHGHQQAGVRPLTTRPVSNYVSPNAFQKSRGSCREEILSWPSAKLHAALRGEQYRGGSVQTCSCCMLHVSVPNNCSKKCLHACCVRQLLGC